MAEKDMTEKMLLDYDDIFADVANAFMFGGEQVIKPESLRSAAVHSVSRQRGKLHERDTAKLWTDGDVIIAFIGIENRTSPDRDICIRIMGYDADAYRSELDDVAGRARKRYPVITFVLYFGEREWGIRCCCRSASAFLRG